MEGSIDWKLACKVQFQGETYKTGSTYMVLCFSSGMVSKLYMHFVVK